MPYVENETRPPEKKSTSMEYSGSEGKKEVTSHFGTNINPIAQGLKELDPETDPDPGVKSLDDDYSLELRDPKHRHGDYLLQLKKYFDSDPVRKIGSETVFFKWVDRITVIQYRQALTGSSNDDDKMKKLFKGMSLGEIAINLQKFQQGVKYKGKLTAEGELATARKYYIEFKNGKVMRLGKMKDAKWVDTGTLEPYSTKGCASHWSGDGWAIWVQGLDGTFYSNRMRIGRFQHSSFLNGGTVRAAGEWIVQDGVIKAISGRSGHYKPTFPQFMRALRDLQAQGIQDFDEIKVELFDKMSFIRNSPVTVAASKLLRQSGAAFFYRLDPSAP